MKTFFVLFKDKQKKILTQSLIMGHIDYIKQLQASGNLMLCGPLGDDRRALWVLQAQDEQHAQELIEVDPFVKHSYYQAFEITELYPANAQNNWLMDSAYLR